MEEFQEICVILNGYREGGTPVPLYLDRPRAPLPNATYFVLFPICSAIACRGEDAENGLSDRKRGETLLGWGVFVGQRSAW